MYRYPVYLILVTVLLVISCKNKNLVERTNPWEQIRYGEYLIENNTWNVLAAKSKWAQTIYCDTVCGSMGWKWDFSGEKDERNNFVVKTFPEIIFGKKPYNNYQSTTSKLPVKLTQAKFTVKYEYSANARAIYNTSTDISFSDSINPGDKNIRAKIMIWFDHQDYPFFNSGKVIKDRIGEQEYKIFIDTTHVGPEGKWSFIALLADTFPAKGNLNLYDYFGYFLSKGLLKPEWYLSSIEIGSEIASGKGEVTFKKFEVY